MQNLFELKFWPNLNLINNIHNTTSDHMMFSKKLISLIIFCFFTKLSTSSPCQPYYGVGIRDDSIRFYDNISTWEECATLCENNPKCLAWSWQHPNSPKKPQRCWLKSAYLSLVQNVHAISGSKACTVSDMCGGGISNKAGKPFILQRKQKLRKRQKQGRKRG